MDITFYGAARFVTGSCTMVSCAGYRILVDCGLAQGNDDRKVGETFAFNPAQIDAVILTHAHIDHSGRIPQLVREGFRGNIYCTGATKALCSIMLSDSAHIQEVETEWKNRKLRRQGLEPVEPMYTVEDAKNSQVLFEECPYRQKISILRGIDIRFVDAGHLLGSSSVEMWLTEGDVTRKIVFSGDIGNLDQPLIDDPHYIENADYIVMESTYGDRLHQIPKGAVGNSIPTEVRARELADIIDRTFRRGGNVIIPSFAVGRTQEILYLIRNIIENGYLKYRIPVFVDSPLSVRATEIFSSNVVGYFDEEAMELVNRGVNPIKFPSLIPITSVEDSRMLNDRKESCVIISSSGMCDAGRIKHHLKHNLWRPECTVVFSGYQAEGTLGRSIWDGAKHVTIFGEQIDVRCEITSLMGISGHADQKGLMKWIGAFRRKPQMIFINHGDKEAALTLSKLINDRLGYSTCVPKLFDTFDLERIDESMSVDEPIVRTTIDNKLMNAAELLNEQNMSVSSLIERFNRAAENGELEEKDKIRLINAINRLASDLEYITIKWNSDVR